MRHVTGSLAVLLVLSLGAFFLWPSSGPIAPLNAQQPSDEEKAKPAKVTKPSSEEAAKEESVEAKLSRKMDFMFEEVPLRDVLSKVSEQAGVEFYIHIKELEDAGVNFHVPVTFKMRGVRIGQGLELMLGDLELVALEHDGLVMVTTLKHAASQLATRVYDCRDLLTMPAIKLPDVVPAQLPGGPFPGGYGEGGGGGYGGGASGVAKPPESTSRPDQLLGIITNAVDTSTWDEIGGPGTMGHYNGLIVITQTASTHKKVENLLDMMRTAAGLETAKGSKVVR